MMTSTIWLGLLVSISLQLASAATTTGFSPRSSIARTRLAFYPRGGSATSIGGSSTSLLTRRKRRKTSKKNINLEEQYDYTPQSQRQEPSLDELRAQLGPIGTFVSNTVELTVVTVGSYLSGGLLGYVGGGVMGTPSILFGKEMGSIAQRFSALNSKAFTSCKSWAQLSAAFTGFHKLVQLCRGGVDDTWNSIYGSALCGAYLNRAGGPQAMLQGGATYAGFTYFMDKFFASPSSRQGQQHEELLYTDVPVGN